MWTNCADILSFQQKTRTLLSVSAILRTRVLTTLSSRRRMCTVMTTTLTIVSVITAYRTSLTLDWWTYCSAVKSKCAVSRAIPLVVVLPKRCRMRSRSVEVSLALRPSSLLPIRRQKSSSTVHGLRNTACSKTIACINVRVITVV